MNWLTCLWRSLKQWGGAFSAEMEHPTYTLKCSRCDRWLIVYPGGRGDEVLHADDCSPMCAHAGIYRV